MEFWRNEFITIERVQSLATRIVRYRTRAGCWQTLVQIDLMTLKECESVCFRLGMDGLNRQIPPFALHSSIDTFRTDLSSE